MKLVAVACAVIVAVPLAWAAGEQHRGNCERASRVSCSVLPWDAGKERPLTHRELMLERRAERLAR